jgi:hypothetical protein
MSEAIKSNKDSEVILAELESDFGGYENTQKIFEIEQQRVAIMERLAVDLQQLDETNTVGIEGKMRSVQYDQEDGTMIYFNQGERNELSRGQLMVAGMWNERYFLDSSVPSDVKRQYLEQQARYQLSDLHDLEIALFESKQRYNQGPVSDTYQAIAAHYEEGYRPEPGELAEKMVESFLTKLSLDYDLPYQLKSVSVYEDVEYKIDFIIEPIEEGTSAVGVGVAEPYDRPEIGIQFTIAKNELTVAHKKKQIASAKSRLEREGERRLRDLILIDLPLEEVAPIFDEWNAVKARRRIPGGPDELWSKDTKEKVFEGILGRVFTEDVVDRMREKISGEVR